MGLPPRSTSTASSAGSGLAARPRRRRSPALRLVGALFALAALAWMARGSPPVRAALRARVSDALAARFPGATLSGDVRLDGLFRVVVGPVTVSAPTGGAPPVLRVESVTLRPRLRPLLAGRVEVASVALDGIRVDAGADGEALVELSRSWASRRRGAAKGPRAAPPSIAFTGALLTVGPLAGSASRVTLGPLAGVASFGADGPASTARVSLRLPQGGEATGRLRWGGGAGSVEVKVRGARVAALPEAWRAHLPVAEDGGSLDLDVDAPRLAAVSAGEARVEAVVRRLFLRDERFSPEPVGPVELRLTGLARWDLRSRTGALERARLDVGESGRAGAPLRIAFAWEGEPRFDLEVSASTVDWGALVAALPPALAPPPEAPALRGTLAGRLRVAGPVHRPEAWRIEGDVDPGALEPAPRGAGGVDLARPFTWQAPLPDGGTRRVVVGPGNPAFVPLGALPPLVVRAVLASEDAGFYGHHGFDLAEIQDAVARSGERRLRGASTITQQIAKNLFLSTERTYARKLREALATIALEASLDKRRLLEIYLNMVEWGPGVFGIGEAARHWFGKDARDLAPKEAAFLATVIPNPVRYEMYRRRGALTERWEGRVKELLVKLRAADVIDDEQLQRASEAPLTFAGGA